MRNFVISMDGPAGSGKERIAKYIAKKYNLYHLDSGLLYRRLAYMILVKNLDLNNKTSMNRFIKSVKMLPLSNETKLRKEKISGLSSKIATFPLVRKFINNQQKIIVKTKLSDFRGCIVDGRDIGSKVFKNAKIKLFIDVKPEIRAKRRHKQLIELGEKSIYSRILKEMNLRDKADINRKTSPMVVPKGAIFINNSASFKETIKQISQALIKI